MAALGVLVWCGATTAEERQLLVAPVRLATSSHTDIFPESWRKEPIVATAEALDDDQFERVSAIFKRAFAKYPESVLARHLKTVYVLSDLKYSGVVTGGTNSRTAVYVKVGDEQRGYTDEAIESLFHAEFSSILLRNRKADFDAAAWQKLNPPDFAYSAGDGVGAIKSGKVGKRSDAKLHGLGFRNEYAQSSLENDFNGYAAALFAGDSEVWELAEKHEAIGGKLALTLAFYRNVDPSLTETHFRASVPK
jgi:hypothetical protein